MSKQILITGGTGYLGKCLAKKYLNCTDESILLSIRAKNETDFKNKIEVINREIGNLNRRVSYVQINLEEAQPFQAINTKTIKSIIHTAAITRFDVEQEDARRVNIEGTIKLLKFAEHCCSLENIGLLSTIYSSGLKAGIIEERYFSDESGFANFYEWSKWETEKCVLEQFSHLPCIVFRSATVVADDAEGKVTQYNVFHNTMRLIYLGLLTLLPGKNETPIYLVTGEFVTDAIFEILSFSIQGKQMIYNLAHSKNSSASLGEIIDTAFETFDRDRKFVKRQVNRPRYIGLRNFNLLMNQVDSFGSTPTRVATSIMRPFAEQLYIEKDIRNERLVAKLDSYTPSNSKELISKTCHYLVANNWGNSIPYTVTA